MRACVHAYRHTDKYVRSYMKLYMRRHMCYKFWRSNRERIKIMLFMYLIALRFDILGPASPRLPYSVRINCFRLDLKRFLQQFISWLILPKPHAWSRPVVLDLMI
jgi:hypothetical protein